MKILIVHPDLSYYGGAELVITKLANYLKEKKHYVRILSLTISDEIIKELNVPILSENRMFDNGLFGILKQVNSLNTSIKNIEDGFDLLFISNFPAELALRKTKTPVVWYCNEPPAYWLDPQARIQFPHKILLWYEKKIVRDYVTKSCVSDYYNASRFTGRYRTIPEIIPYGIDYDFFSKGDAEKAVENYTLKDSFVVLQVGMITQQKNQLRSIQAIEKLKDKIPNIKLILAGDYNSYYASELMQYVSKHKLSHYITFLSNIKREKLRDLYAACNVLIHPIKSQGGWLTPFECMCTGKPVIVSPEFTASDIIREERIGIVTSEYENAIKFVHDKSNYDTEKGKMYVKENLTLEKFGEKMMVVFEEVVK